MNELKAMRQSKGMTQRQLSEASGVNLRLVQHYEQGFKDINKANVTTVLKLANALGCDIKEILREG